MPRIKPGRPKGRSFEPVSYMVQPAIIKAMDELAEQNHGRSASEVARTILAFGVAVAPVAKASGITVAQLLAHLAKQLTGNAK